MVSSFKTFSQELANFAKKVFNSRWIDAEPRAGKCNYGLAVDIFPIAESRIIANFNGNFSDVSVLAHEIGHAYHSYFLEIKKC
ncbi:M3 family metallopeptidase [Clostridium bowmanii]|uniref:M3 family metallopeptidase n=1 Tax=Clostridium bowmanii TaxID=132925 RepID=UPI001CD68CBB|nr:M3 family metallopeptidase [Clostridium bowmanii]